MIAPDKVAHFAGGVLIFAALSWFSILAAFIAVVVAAVGKEIYDSRHKDVHTPDVWDAVATILGGVVGVFIKLS